MSRLLRFLLTAAVLVTAVTATTNSTSLGSAKTCPKGQFMCKNDGRCIPLIKWQDGIADCLDESDEECLEWQFDCIYGKPKCISQRQVKDGVIDCMSGFDEGCPSHYFVCTDRSACIDISKYLDGHPDCRDASDEPCGPDQFFCHDRLGCVARSRFQDGRNDCADGSDEECTQNQFECPCGSPRCVSTSKVGDGRRDCADGADERRTGSKPPKTCSDGSRPRANGISTSLAPRKMVLCDPHNNPCLEQLGQMCVVVGGTWKCVCKMGTVRPPGSVRCIPNELLQDYLANPLSNCSQAKSDLEEQYAIPTPKPFVPLARVVINPKKGPNNTEAAISTRRRTQQKPTPLPTTFYSQDEVYIEVKPPCDPQLKYSCPKKGEKCVKSSSGEYRCECAGKKVEDKCIVLVNECDDPELNDCHEHAVCMDNVHSYECFCKEGYIDMSDSPTVRPGVKCKKLVNECKQRFWNDCDHNATCIDKPDGYTCQCKPGYLDISEGGAANPGRKCLKKVDECLEGTHKCDANAICEDLPYGYRCKCAPGFVDATNDPRLRGRVCTQLIVECDLTSSKAVDLPDGSTRCECLKGFVDMNPQKPGTKCRRMSSNPCQDYSLHDCDAVAECVSDEPGYFHCQCPKGFYDVSENRLLKPGRKCKKIVDECALGTHECDTNADCVDTPEGYSCRCKSGYSDRSPDPLNAPGRSCRKGDQCAHAECAREAECRETPSGPVCQCGSGFVDISRQHGQLEGRICRMVINECAERTHDCSPNAACIDTAESFTCRCKDGFRDESPDFRNKPGRMCIRTFVPEAPECNVNDPMSCDQHKSEVCLYRNGTYKCACASGYSRLPDGRCLVINECQDPKLNDCAANADCIDQAEGYTCQCRSGFADVSPPGLVGRICRRRVNECQNPEKFAVNCDANAVCVDTDESYACRCRPGFADTSAQFNLLPGRKCVEAVNECLDRSLNECSDNAICEDAKEGYTCTCRTGFVDASPNITHYPGRVCNKPKPPTRIDDPTIDVQEDSCDIHSPKCGVHEICTDRKNKGQYVCDCEENAFRYEDGTCRLFHACDSSSDCDKNAQCVNAFDTFKCQCKPGFMDISPDPEKNPGRRCKELVNECATNEHTCSPFASCIDSTESYACVCMDGFIDTSSQYSLPPGRKCSNASNECLDKSLNTCSENADCIDTPDGYICQCYAGFVDQSSNARLLPGRVCEVDTLCGKQKTDLMFLIDGSGSIGSYVFKNEVLRFVKEFVQLFDIGLENTRVGLIQYSDQIRHEFDLNQYTDENSLQHAIVTTQYLTGLTRTGAAIQHMVMEGFSERRGARPQSDDISRVAIVITDGRSQDNVTGPAISARNLHVNTFAIGVTDHVLASELESIAGSPHRWFYVDRFKDLDTRLRSLIQKIACPNTKPESPANTTCSVEKQTGCARELNERCVDVGSGVTKCQCPDKFQRHPETRVCGGHQCNPQLATSCPNPEICAMTHLSNHRCVCPPGFAREQRYGFCVSTTEVHVTQPPVSHQHDADCNNGGVACSRNEQCIRERATGRYTCECALGFERNYRTRECSIPGSCDPTLTNACDLRKRERCLLHNSGRYHTCQCAAKERRHPVTEVCLRNECLDGSHDCDRSAKCVDTDDSYICACPAGFLDQSPDPVNHPGRLCVAEQNECTAGTHRCSPHAICTDTPEGYVCRCKPGFVDFSPNPHSFGGLVCKELVNECAAPHLNTCHRDAICIDTMESYKCICNPGFTDLDELRNPGRNCQKVQHNERCLAGHNDCDRNARCIQRGENDFVCACLPGFRDKSPDPLNRPGRVCILIVPECDNPTHNDCDSPDRAICTDTDESYVCRCRQGFLDISPNIATKPGRLCKPLVNECAMGTDDCAREGGICEDTPDSFTCRCAINYLDVSFDRTGRPGRKCKRLVDECATGQNDCSPEAICTDTEDSYVCACPANFLDVSPDVARKPGRRCLLRINECAEGKHDCSPNADCQDTPESFKCKCRDDFIDDNPQRPGRVCRPALIDECRLGKHDCHRDAMCRDLPQGFSCQCKPEFLDESPHRVTHPGRLCVPRPTPPPDECRLDSAASCKVELNEVCRLMNGIPKCACPINYNRDPATRACTMINECQFPQLNDCHPSAECIDQPVSYTCRCRQGFKDLSPSDRPGRSCQPLVNECQFPHLNDCHLNAACTDLPEGYQCRCNEGFMDRNPSRPGRICQQMIDECARPDLNSCDKNARCIDQEEGYKCECKPNFLDVSPSPTLRGRACRPIVNECADPKMNDCDKLARCIDTMDSYQCQCPANSKDISPNAAFPGRVCLIYENECLTGKHDCDTNAMCRDNEQSFTCECKPGFTDRSPNKLTRPGRVCVELIDECKTGRHTCSAQAECRDLEEGYTCECKDGFVDRSPNLQTQPGRVCGTPEVCPTNHECSSAAVCEPLGGNKYKCTCIQGYVDQSPEGTEGRICVRNNACRDPRLNTCSRNAVCYDEPKGYRCECARGYIDRSPEGGKRGQVCEPPTPPTPPPRHPCQDPNLNDCHAAGTCRATGPKSYTCECLKGYADRSQDIRNKPGRVCVLTEPVCLDNTQNDCHSAAICSETESSVSGDKYTCRCRDGYTDQSPDRQKRPGRICIEQVNECLDRSLNDCDPLAVCQDLPEGYTCRCPVNSIDQSPDPNRAGRRCFQQVNECRNQNMNNCSRFADCIDKQVGYECRCRQGYHDDNPSHPGTICSFMQNECESANLNDCDRHAQCIDLPGGYDCRCLAPYRDEGPSGRPGRVCRLNECLDPKMNTCDKNAICQDLDDGYLCQCKDGFYDNSKNPLEPGRVCLAFELDTFTKAPIQPTVQQFPQHEGIPCGRNNYCSVARHEVCVGGTRCACRPGEGRAGPKDRCQPIDRIPLSIRVTHEGSQPLFYSSEYGNPDSVAYVEITDQFSKDFGRTVGGTSYAPRYVTTDVNYITHPKTVNSSWPDGLLFNFTVGTTPSSKIDVCDLWDQLMESLQRSNGAIGGGNLRVSADVDLLNPCRRPEPVGESCGGHTCKADLGEVCIAGSICGCPHGEKRATVNDVCRPVESWTMPLWVIRKDHHNLVYNSSFGNPLDAVNREYVQRFESGVSQCYPHTSLKNAFVSAEVNEIVDPMNVNASWDTGILFNCTMHFRKGAVRIPSDAYYMLVRYIVDRNNYQVGDSGLYLNPYQPDPFKACFKNNCHPKGVCIDLGPNAYRCECAVGYRDKNPADPGRKCLPDFGYNECEKKEDNECSENARCIDQEHLYKCECNKGFSDASPPGAIPGSLCVLDYCSDIDFCPTNTTCKNLEQQAECKCNHGFVDIRKSESRLNLGYNADQYCLSTRDVDECALQITNCSGVAECADRAIGYECKCPDGYIDGNPAEPGRICGALLCDVCNQHGDCVHNSMTNNVTCVCSDGWTGEFCNVAPSNASTILFIILAILFLLLMLCCLLFLCSRCACLEGTGIQPFTHRQPWPWATLDGSTSSESGALSASGHDIYPDIGIPRAKLKEGISSSSNRMIDHHASQLSHILDDVRIPRAHLAGGRHNASDSFDSYSEASSEYTIREDVERRIITDVTIKETRTTVTTDAEVHESAAGSGIASAEFHVYPPSDMAGLSHSSGTHNTEVVHRRRGSMAAMHDEQERGESVVEFSNAHSSRHWSSGDFSELRGSSEYATDRDADSIDSESTQDEAVFDKKTLVKKSQGVDADGTQRYRTEVTTTKTSKETTKH